jgi:hypothetical protein
LLAAACTYCTIGPLQRRPVVFEPESAVTLDHASLEERRRVTTEWIRIRRPRYSGGGAVVTSARGATLRGSLSLKPGDYRVSVSVVHPAPGYTASFEVTLGGVTRVLRTDPALPRGTHELAALFPDVKSGELRLTSITPGKPSLMIDSVAITSAR